MKYWTGLLRPVRPNPNLSFEEELAERDEATGILQRHVTWSTRYLSREEQARALLDHYWREDRGYFVGQHRFGLKGWWLRFRGTLYELMDRAFGIESPYTRTDHGTDSSHPYIEGTERGRARSSGRQD